MYWTITANLTQPNKLVNVTIDHWKLRNSYLGLQKSVRIICVSIQLFDKNNFHTINTVATFFSTHPTNTILSFGKQPLLTNLVKSSITFWNLNSNKFFYSAQSLVLLQVAKADKHPCFMHYKEQSILFPHIISNNYKSCTTMANAFYQEINLYRVMFTHSHHINCANIHNQKTVIIRKRM